MTMEHRYFYCYSKRLMRALRSHGFRYICIGVNKRTDSEYYLYESSKELQYYKDNVYPNERDNF